MLVSSLFLSLFVLTALAAPVADAESEDVEKLEIAVVPDSEALDDCEAVLEVSG